MVNHPLGYQKLTVSNTAIGLTVPDGSTFVVARVTAADVMFRDDGTAPTTTDGQPLSVDDVLIYDGDLAAIRFIRAGSADATVHCHFYAGRAH